MPRQTWHIIEGEAGCAYAVERGCAAVIVDALRASVTAAMLFEAEASEILIVREVEEARAARQAFPDALLYGERGGLPPDGFDFGNSPRDAAAAAGRRVIFTTTTGAGRMLSAWGAPAVLMGSTVNASAVVSAASSVGADVVLIPAGLATDPGFDAQEDWAAAATIATCSGMLVGRGSDRYAYWCERIASEGLERLFQTAPHAAKLRTVGLGKDVAFCARCDITSAVPQAVERNAFGLRCLPHPACRPAGYPS